MAYTETIDGYKDYHYDELKFTRVWLDSTLGYASGQKGQAYMGLKIEVANRKKRGMHKGRKPKR